MPRASAVFVVSVVDRRVGMSRVSDRSTHVSRHSANTTLTTFRVWCEGPVVVWGVTIQAIAAMPTA